MSYKDYLTRYGSPTDSAEIRPYIYITAPESMKATKDVVWRDTQIAGSIAQLEHILSDLREYRQALAARYAELATTTYTYRLYLVREKSWCTKKVSYTVRLARVLPDGKEIDERREDFPGTDRKKAFELFAQLKKERPGIEAIQDTDKKQWKH